MDVIKARVWLKCEILNHFELNTCRRYQMWTLLQSAKFQSNRTCATGFVFPAEGTEGGNHRMFVISVGLWCTVWSLNQIGPCSSFLHCTSLFTESIAVATPSSITKTQSNYIAMMRTTLWWKCLIFRYNGTCVDLHFTSRFQQLALCPMATIAMQSWSEMDSDAVYKVSCWSDHVKST